jgi:hypothetical protein
VYVTGNIANDLSLSMSFANDTLKNSKVEFFASILLCSALFIMRQAGLVILWSVVHSLIYCAS